MIIPLYKYTLMNLLYLAHVAVNMADTLGKAVSYTPLQYGKVEQALIIFPISGLTRQSRSM